MRLKSEDQHCSFKTLSVPPQLKWMTSKSKSLIAVELVSLNKSRIVETTTFTLPDNERSFYRKVARCKQT